MSGTAHTTTSNWHDTDKMVTMIDKRKIKIKKDKLHAGFKHLRADPPPGCQYRTYINKPPQASTNLWLSLQALHMYTDVTGLAGQQCRSDMPNMEGTVQHCCWSFIAAHQHGQQANIIHVFHWLHAFHYNHTSTRGSSAPTGNMI